MLVGRWKTLRHSSQRHFLRWRRRQSMIYSCERVRSILGLYGTLCRQWFHRRAETKDYFFFLQRNSPEIFAEFHERIKQHEQNHRWTQKYDRERDWAQRHDFEVLFWKTKHLVFISENISSTLQKIFIVFSLGHGDRVNSNERTINISHSFQKREQND